MYNYYPKELKTILIYLEHLDAADKEISKVISADAPYLKAIDITDGDGTNYGQLVDEIGGAWSWKPSESSDV